jgi:DNA replicative helicase MCM subunit Mcm2 (Cdc46/Mcm family)
MNEEASFICDSCGEEIVIPLDISQGANQSYVEDCPVCCHPNVIHVTFDVEGRVTIDAQPEQDYQ